MSIAKEGICRINLGFVSAIGYQKPSQEVADATQNVNIRIDNGVLPFQVRIYAQSLNMSMLWPVPLPTARRGTSLSNSLEAGTYRLETRLSAACNVSARGFEKVAVRIWMIGRAAPLS